MRRSFTALLLVAAGCSFPEYAVQETEPVQVGTCRDGLLSVDEIDVDCGPMCGASCATGKVCSADSECVTGFCGTGTCAVPSCTDQARNRTETDADCGGSDGCKACTVGQRCASNFDCDGGACSNGRCQAPNCHDGIQNQDESDVDCGGTHGCDLCLTKQHCSVNADCFKAKCSQGRCQAEGCDDGVQNGDETGMDCGGACPSCDDGVGCEKSDDCKSLVCNAKLLRCSAATCNDAVQNGAEPSVDCGGGCPSKCALLEPCKVGADCQSGACSELRCVPKTPSGAALPTSGWRASASASFNQETFPDRALDGSQSTHWTSGTGQLPGMWFELDMLAPRPFFAIELICSSNDDYPRSIRALLSDDGETFTPVTGTIAGTKALRFDFPTARVARYIKLELEQDTGGLWWRIDELRVLQ